MIGWGEGGLLALYAAALDPRIDAVCVSGYFDSRQNVWQEPIDRNVFGLLEQFGDAELASLIAPRPLIVEAAAGPEVDVPPGTGGGPGRLATPKLDDVRREVDRAERLVAGLQPPAADRAGRQRRRHRAVRLATAALEAFLGAAVAGREAGAAGPPPEDLAHELRRRRPASSGRSHELDRHTPAAAGRERRRAAASS